MIQLKHIQDLDAKVQSALLLITRLRDRNNELVSKLDGYQKRIVELEGLVRDFKADQGEIEAGILRALEQLDSLEDSVSDEGPPIPEVKPSELSKTDTKSETPKENTTGGDSTQKAKPQTDSEQKGKDAPDESTDEAVIATTASSKDEDVGADDADTDTPDIGESELDIF